MEIREEHQANPVEDPVGALVAVTRPILGGIVSSIGAEYLEAYDGNRSVIPLRMLGRLRKQGDGDTGIAFEYAIHDAVRNSDPVVQERVAEALARCRITQGEPRSILFAIEKRGAKQLVDTDLTLVTEESRVLSGLRGQPAKLKRHMNQLAAAFRRPTTRPNLPRASVGSGRPTCSSGPASPTTWWARRSSTTPRSSTQALA